MRRVKSWVEQAAACTSVPPILENQSAAPDNFDSMYADRFYKRPPTSGAPPPTSGGGRIHLDYHHGPQTSNFIHRELCSITCVLAVKRSAQPKARSGRYPIRNDTEKRFKTIWSTQCPLAAALQQGEARSKKIIRGVPLFLVHPSIAPDNSGTSRTEPNPKGCLKPGLRCSIFTRQRRLLCIKITAFTFCFQRTKRRDQVLPGFALH